MLEKKDLERAPNTINSEAATAISALIQAVELWKPQLDNYIPLHGWKLHHQAMSIPRTSLQRQQISCSDVPIDVTTLSDLAAQASKDDTVLYLAYGSNLSAETFLGKRGIKPLSQVNIVAPSISLTFDLPGLPYSEPCFANSRYRDEPEHKPAPGKPPYHKNAWKKGLVGVVYEVTKQDYAHIIATEGGGSGYHDVLVDCYALEDDEDAEVPTEPKTNAFKAHTLYAHRSKSLRDDPDYAQPSPRYLKLITDGALEHKLPKEYRYFLEHIRTYRSTTTQQLLGSFIFLAVWGPIFAFFFGGGAAVFLRKDGTYPKWFTIFTQAVFTASWASYDGFFIKLFGDGERTIGDDQDMAESETAAEDLIASEKTPLLIEQSARMSGHV